MSFSVEFEVEDRPGELPPQKVLQLLQEQLSDPTSFLRAGDTPFFAATRLSGPGLRTTTFQSFEEERPWIDAPPAGLSFPTGPRPPAAADANSELLHEIRDLRSRLAQVEGARDALPSARFPPTTAPSWWEANTSAKLKEQEQRLQHAQDMWMRENLRAHRLAESLSAAEDKLADKERQFGRVAHEYDMSQQEVKQLKHIIGADDAPVGLNPATLEIPPGVSKGLQPPPSAGDTQAGLYMPALGSMRSMMPVSNGRPDHLYGTAQVDGNAERFRVLCSANDALLYEDDVLQIGIKAKYFGSSGQVDVYFANKTVAPLSAFRVGYLLQDQSALSLMAGQLPIGNSLDARKQEKQEVIVKCLEPFAEPPWLQVEFLQTDATPWRARLKFPVVITKFMSGVDLSPQQFFDYWRQQDFVLSQGTGILRLSSRFRGSLMHITRSILFSGGLMLLRGIDVNPDNLVLAGRVSVAKGSSLADENQGPLVLARVEVGKERFSGKARISIRSSDSIVSRAVRDAIIQQLAEVQTDPLPF